MIDPELLERLQKTPPDFAVHFHSGYCNPCAWTSRMLRDLPAIIRALSAAQEYADAKREYNAAMIAGDAHAYWTRVDKARAALLAEFPMKAGGPTDD